MIERFEKLPVNPTDVSNLTRGNQFDGTQARALIRLRSALNGGLLGDRPQADHRVEFVRWLAQHERINERGGLDGRVSDVPNTVNELMSMQGPLPIEEGITKKNSEK